MFSIKKDNRLVIPGISNGTSTTTLPTSSNYGEYIVRGNNSYIVGGTSNVCIGCNSGFSNQNSGAVAIGIEAGKNNQGFSSVAIGSNTGMNSQGTYSISIGLNTGSNNSGYHAISLGTNSGVYSAGNNSISIGQDSGFSSSGERSISIGTVAGKNQCGTDNISIGYFSAWISTGVYGYSNAISIGRGTSYNGIGTNSISIGSIDGDLGIGINQQSLGCNNIIINASGLAQTANSNAIVLIADPTDGIVKNASDGFFVKPIRSDIVSNALYYNTLTNEITYEPSLRDMKTNIQDISLGSDNIYNLQPRSYNLVNSDKTNIGYIAEEVFDIDEKLSVIQDNKPVNINWNVLCVYLVNEMKKLKNEIENLKQTTK